MIYCIYNTRLILFILTILFFAGCARPIFKSAWASEKSPENFIARFETSKGAFDIRVSREWSPKAADRFYQLVKHHYYDNAVFYRVVPAFVVQFGNSDTTINARWNKFIIPDEKVTYSNKKGTLSFARAGKESRGTELFINLKDNLLLDSMDYAGVKGFPAFGDVITGMESVESIYSGYGDNTMNQLDTMYSNRSKFLNDFPKLDSIIKVYILKSK